jgi:hypothetical protein
LHGALGIEMVPDFFEPAAVAGFFDERDTIVRPYYVAPRFEIHAGMRRHGKRMLALAALAVVLLQARRREIAAPAMRAGE